jgi:hypothetical protein
MRISAQAFHAPKAGNQESEYEDALCPEVPLIGEKGSVFRFAVGDGATETSFARIWAKQLVRAFCKGKLEGDEFPLSMRSLRERWLKFVSKKAMPWYMEEKVRSGAFAAVVGLALHDSTEGDEEGMWRALAIGDCCVFQVRRRKLVTSFPIQSSCQFNSSPLLLSSRGALDQDDSQAILTMCGTWRKGDAFYLMSDAVACWFLTQVEKGRVPSRELQDLSPNKGEDFDSWLASLREHKAIRNDDVTVLRIEIEQD